MRVGGNHLAARITVPLTDPGAVAAVNKLIDALEEHDDVKEVYSNAEFPVTRRE